MFQIVSPAHYAHHEGLIQEYKAKLLEVNDKDIPEEEQRQAFYVICQEGGRGVVGGAYLVKKSVEGLPVALRESLHLLNMKEPVWQCAGLYILNCLKAILPFSCRLPLKKPAAAFIAISMKLS